jgi:hypothetical protein
LAPSLPTAKTLKGVIKRGEAPLFLSPLSLIKRGGLRGRDFLLDKYTPQRVK